MRNGRVQGSEQCCMHYLRQPLEAVLDEGVVEGVLTAPDGRLLEGLTSNIFFVVGMPPLILLHCCTFQSENIFQVVIALATCTCHADGFCRMVIMLLLSGHE